MNTSTLETRLAVAAEDIRRRARIPGLSVAVSAGGKRAAVCLGTAAVGSGLPLNPAARFQIGCITKVLTCAVAMQLAHEGKIDLNGTIEEYLPDLTGPGGGRDIRIRHLGTHTSGYRGLNPSNPEHGYFYSWPKFVEFFRHTQQVFRPGSVFNYEHTECVILGEVIRRVAGVPCEALIRDLILQPLGLVTGSIAHDGEHSGFCVADHALHRGSGQYVTVRSVPYCGFWAASLSSMTVSPVDLVAVGEMLSGLRRPSGFCGEAVDAIVRQTVAIPCSSGGPEREVSPRSFGFGCARYSPGVFGHNGSARGQTCGLRFSPRDGVVVVVALNCWDPYARDALLEEMLGLLLPDRAPEPDAPEGQSDLNMSELEGTYAGCVPGLEIVVTRSGDGLVCAIGGLGTGAQKLNVDVRFDETGRLRARCPLKHLSLGFFREESTGAPAMLVGLNAFKKAN